MVKKSGIAISLILYVADALKNLTGVKSLDNKASRIIAISGIVLSLETSFVSVLFNNIPRGF